MAAILDLKKSDNSLYKDFFYSNGSRSVKIIDQWIKDEGLCKTQWRGKPSMNSFSLASPCTSKRQIPDILINRFGIQNKNHFKKKYEEAISGDGQEWRRITTLHSSSLIALLCFYNIEVKELKFGDYTFNKSFFEVRTRVGGGFSNMDVVLRGKDKNEQEVVLFLESKFSEYLKGGKCDDISYDTYYKTYDNLKLFQNPISNVRFDADAKNNKISIVNSRNNPIYCEGIKQMLSHYIGVSGYNKDRGGALTSGKKAHKSFKADSNEKVLLGEILFDFGNNIPNANARLDNYKLAYSELSKIINEKGNIKMLDNVLTYQGVFTNENFFLDPIVREFYNF